MPTLYQVWGINSPKLLSYIIHHGAHLGNHWAAGYRTLQCSTSFESRIWEMNQELNRPTSRSMKLERVSSVGRLDKGRSSLDSH